jgi:hypothetical protein
VEGQCSISMTPDTRLRGEPPAWHTTCGRHLHEMLHRGGSCAVTLVSVFRFFNSLDVRRGSCSGDARTDAGRSCRCVVSNDRIAGAARQTDIGRRSRPGQAVTVGLCVGDAKEPPYAACSCSAQSTRRCRTAMGAPTNAQKCGVGVSGITFFLKYLQLTHVRCGTISPRACMLLIILTTISNSFS